VELAAAQHRNLGREKRCMPVVRLLDMLPDSLEYTPADQTFLQLGGCVLDLQTLSMGSFSERMSLTK
jgi:hypothetical protein